MAPPPGFSETMEFMIPLEPGSVSGSLMNERVSRDLFQGANHFGLTVLNARPDYTTGAAVRLEQSRFSIKLIGREHLTMDLN